MSDPNATKSPERKRPKQAKPRTRYLFQPKNTLAFTPSAARATASSTTTTTADGASRAAPPRENDGGVGPAPRRPAVPPPPPPAAVIQVSSQPSVNQDACAPLFRNLEAPEQQSSDDSFDGVRWRPLQVPGGASRPILSSPLKNVEPMQNDMIAETVANEVTDSILSKYGTAMANPLSQTPRYTRTHSDGAKLALETSPTLSRSKSFDPRSLRAHHDAHPAPGASRLNTWIDKFADKIPLAESPAAESSPKRPVSQSSDDDRMSSDDDSLLASLAVPSARVLPPAGGPEPHHAAHGPPSSQLLAKESVDDTDPFSDDIDIAVLASLGTQPSGLSSGPSASTKGSSNGSSTSSLSRPPASAPAKPAAPPALSAPPIPNYTSKYEEKDLGAKLSFSRPEFTRYQIISIFKTSYTMQNHKRKQLVLTVADAESTTTKIIVRGEAAELDLAEGDLIHVIYTSPENHKLVSDTNNLLIWNPDVLVSSTTVADQLFCPRKTVLGMRLTSPNSSSLPRLVGMIVHEIFQACSLTGKYTTEFIEQLLESEIQSRLLEIYSVGDVIEDLTAKVHQHIPYVQEWFSKFYKKPPVEIPTNKAQQKIRFSVSEVLDIEEYVWSPMFGIKGIADLTLRANLQGESAGGQFLLPMELKTAQANLSHQAQAALYSLLFKDRYNVDISSFLLVNTSNGGSTTKYDISVADLKSLVNLRNRISYFLRKGVQERPGLMKQQKCDRCFAQENCMTYNFLAEDGTPEESGLNEGTYEELTSHLIGNDKYKEFLATWDGLLTKEEEFVNRFNKDLWIYTSKERESEQGKALADLVISDVAETDANNSGFVYTFKRNSAGPYKPMNASQIMKYDKVMVSDNNGHFALAQGFVRYVEKDFITITTARRIVPTESKSDRFHRAGVLRPTQTSKRACSPSQPGTETVVFRIDKDDMFYGLGVARFNILNLFLASGDHKRRDLIVNLRPPNFSRNHQFVVDSGSGGFNDHQIMAFNKVSTTEDYSLILGMPGTGKTTVIAYLIKMLVAAKKTVLLTSYTNSAVDNILLKLKELDVDFLRVGKTSRIHQDVREYTPFSERNHIESYQDFERIYMQPLVVATTCLSVFDLAFSVRDQFDYCIVDEASQVSMPLSLGPLALCDKFVLVGDHFQLPPLVSHPDAEVKAGLSQSLFQILATAHPQSVVELKEQYRMCEDIMFISNQLVYQNRLSCGSPKVAHQTLSIPDVSRLKSFLDPCHSLQDSWLSWAMEEQNQVILFNHDPIPGYERSVGENITNLTEVELVRQTVESLVACGVSAAKIGVMTLYRSQLKLLCETFRHLPDLEILTADRFQGRDKDCIIISMVRSNKDKRAGELLRDWRRVNVAVTRARAKLIVFGSSQTLSNAESIRDFVNLVDAEGWTYNLPQNALSAYNFPKHQGSPRKGRFARKTVITPKTVGAHPIVRDILADVAMN